MFDVSFLCDVVAAMCGIVANVFDLSKALHEIAAFNNCHVRFKNSDEPVEHQEITVRLNFRLPLGVNVAVG